MSGKCSIETGKKELENHLVLNEFKMGYKNEKLRIFFYSV